jgi:hypothetical protein
VLDAIGRTVEVKNLLSVGGSIRLGENYRNGFYYAVVVQGSEKVRLKLVKKTP